MALMRALSAYFTIYDIPKLFWEVEEADGWCGFRRWLPLGTAVALGMVSMAQMLANKCDIPDLTS